MWSYALLLKTRELAQSLVEKKKDIDFCKPAYNVERQDSEDIRQKILNISYTDGKIWDSLKGHCIT
jgi:CRISPR-associated protein Cas1